MSSLKCCNLIAISRLHGDLCVLLLALLHLSFIISGKKFSPAWESHDPSICILACKHHLISWIQCRPDGRYAALWSACMWFVDALKEQWEISNYAWNVSSHFGCIQICKIIVCSQQANNAGVGWGGWGCFYTWLTDSVSCVVVIWTIPICNLIMQTSNYNASCCMISVRSSGQEAVSRWLMCFVLCLLLLHYLRKQAVCPHKGHEVPCLNM